MAEIDEKLAELFLFCLDGLFQTFAQCKLFILDFVENTLHILIIDRKELPLISNQNIPNPPIKNLHFSYKLFGIAFLLLSISFLLLIF